MMPFLACPSIAIQATEPVGGRGPHLVDAFADDRQAYRCPRGNDVTACFPPPTPARSGMHGEGLVATGHDTELVGQSLAV